MMDLLHITSIRRGKDGMNTNSPYYANYDEAGANPFPDLPDPLVLKNGKKVTTAEMWWKQRRPEIMEDFDREIYGRVPANLPKVKWEVTSTTTETNGTVPVITKKLVGHVDNSSDTNITVNIDLTLSTPANATGPVPVMMQFGFNFASTAADTRMRRTGRSSWSLRPGILNPFPRRQPGEFPPDFDWLERRAGGNQETNTMSTAIFPSRSLP